MTAHERWDFVRFCRSMNCYHAATSESMNQQWRENRKRQTFSNVWKYIDRIELISNEWNFVYFYDDSGLMPFCIHIRLWPELAVFSSNWYFFFPVSVWAINGWMSFEQRRIYVSHTHHDRCVAYILLFNIWFIVVFVRAHSSSTARVCLFSVLHMYTPWQCRSELTVADIMYSIIEYTIVVYSVVCHVNM